MALVRGALFLALSDAAQTMASIRQARSGHRAASNEREMGNMIASLRALHWALGQLVEFHRRRIWYVGGFDFFIRACTLRRQYLLKRWVK
jgi:hypothetical protein